MRLAVYEIHNDDAYVLIDAIKTIFLRIKNTWMENTHSV